MAEQNPVIDMPFPALGLDRRLAYQQQPPHTTPDALNVRPTATPERRERGGSRPCLAPAALPVLYTGITPHPVRMLSTVTISDETAYVYWADDFSGVPASVWTSPAGTYGDFTIRNGYAFSSVADVGGIRADLTLDAASPYIVEMYIVPDDGVHCGDYHLWARMADTSPDETDASVDVTLSLAPDGTYTGTAKVYVAGTPTSYDLTGGDEGFCGAGWFSLYVNGDAITVYWRGTKILDAQDISEPAGTRVGFGISPDNGICQVGRFRVQYYQEGSYGLVHRTKRPMLVAVCNGDIWTESFMGVMERSTGTAQDDIQQITVDATGGTFLIGYGSNWSNAIDWNATAAAVETALIEQVDVDDNWTNDSINVTGDAGGPYTIEFTNALGEQNMTELSVDGTGLSGGTGVTVLTTQNGAADNGVKLSTDSILMSAERNGKLYIADFSPDPLSKGTDAKISGAYVSRDSTAAWQTYGVTPSYGIRLKATLYNEIQKIELTKCTSGTFRLYLAPYIEDNISEPIDWNVTPAALQSQLRTEIAAIADNGSVTVSLVSSVAGDRYFVQFDGAFAGKSMGLLTPTDVNTDGQVTVQRMRSGGLGTDTAANIDVVSQTSLKTKYYAQTLADDETTFAYTIERAPKIYNPVDNTLIVWEATPGKGVVPLGCEVIARYRDRMVLAGDPESPNQWYMSRQGDPHDWDYSQDDASAAVTDQVSDAGQIGQPITALIARGDECLMFGCTGSLWILRGDPAHGGQVDNLSRTIGVVDKDAWCYGPGTECYFLSDDGLYLVEGACGGSFPRSLSRERLPMELVNVNRDLVTVQLVYDTDYRGVHIFLTYKSEGNVPKHFFFDATTHSFWPQKFLNDHEPTSTVYYRGQDSAETGVILGCRDGQLRRFSRVDEQDDGGNPVTSYVDMGPYRIGDGLRESLVSSIRGVTGDGGPVTWQLRTGESPEEAYDASYRASGVWKANGTNPLVRPRLRGSGYVLRVSGKQGRRWSFEGAVAEILPQGDQRT